MPKRIPRLDREFAAKALLAIGVVRAGEAVRAAREPIGAREWTISRLEALYELAYLRVFAAWEAHLEAVFCRSLCGYASSAGQERLVGGRAYYPSLAAAEAAMLGGRRYLLWHSPHDGIQRGQRFIQSGAPGCPYLSGEVTPSVVG